MEQEVTRNKSILTGRLEAKFVPYRWPSLFLINAFLLFPAGVEYGKGLS